MMRIIHCRYSHRLVPTIPRIYPSLARSYASSTAQHPHYRLAFSCAHCTHVSIHHVSHQGYHHGSVLITCPDCRHKHVISDHLHLLTRQRRLLHKADDTAEENGTHPHSVADVVRQFGRLVKIGSLGGDGNLELWAEAGEVGDDGGRGISGADVGGRTARNGGSGVVAIEGGGGASQLAMDEDLMGRAGDAEGFVEEEEEAEQENEEEQEKKQEEDEEEAEEEEEEDDDDDEEDDEEEEDDE